MRLPVLAVRDELGAGLDLDVIHHCGELVELSRRKIGEDPQSRDPSRIHERHRDTATTRATLRTSPHLRITGGATVPLAPDASSRFWRTQRAARRWSCRSRAKAVEAWKVSSSGSCVQIQLGVRLRSRWLGQPVPPGLSGSQLTRGDRGSLAAAVRVLIGRDTAEQVWISTHGWFFTAYGVTAAALLIAPVLLFWGSDAERARRRSSWWRTAGVFAAAVPARHFPGQSGAVVAAHPPGSDGCTG